MNESILNSIKHMLGIEPTYDHFDQDLIIYINSALFYLKQIGVGDTVFRITGSTETWHDFASNIDEIPSVKELVYMRVRKAFDPPTSGILMEAINSQIKELEWRVYSEVDFGKETTNESEQ